MLVLLLGGQVGLNGDFVDGRGLLVTCSAWSISFFSRSTAALSTWTEAPLRVLFKSTARNLVEGAERLDEGKGSEDNKGMGELLHNFTKLG